MMKREYSGDITNRLENDVWHNYCVAPLLFELVNGTTINAPFLMLHCSTTGRIQGETAWNTR
jgi:hypothetical protein